MSKLGYQPVGSTIKLNVNGTATDFIIVQQGLPSSLYDSSCDGTWLLMKDLYTKSRWDDRDNDYKNSVVHSYLNSTFLSLLDSDIQSVIRQVKIPYQNGTGEEGSVSSGSNGLSTKIFLLAQSELTAATSSSSFLRDGSLLNYFNDDTAELRIALYDGVATGWWSRSPKKTSESDIKIIGASGGFLNQSYRSSYGYRPALIMDPKLKVKSDGTVLSKRFNGYSNIGGANKELTSGYANIGGTWKEIVSGYINVGGAWKEMS